MLKLARAVADGMLRRSPSLRKVLKIGREVRGQKSEGRSDLFHCAGHGTLTSDSSRRHSDSIRGPKGEEGKVARKCVTSGDKV